MRPIFSPTEFIQIKGRGTRIHNFEHKYNDGFEVQEMSVKKTSFKLFDFFAVCEYFEEKYNYDQVLNLPSLKPSDDEVPIIVVPKPKKDGYEYTDDDKILQFNETIIGLDGMKVDNMFLKHFRMKLSRMLISNKQWRKVIWIQLLILHLKNI